MAKVFLHILYVATILSVLIEAVPFKVEEFKKAFAHQDKLCSMNFQENDGSYSSIFESLTGYNVPSYVPGSSKKPYTGFKILRAYKLQLFSLSIERSLIFVFCNHGILEWQSFYPLADDMDWNLPICVSPPDINIPKKKVGRIAKTWASLRGKDLDLTPRVNPEDDSQNNLQNLHCFKLARRKKYSNDRSLFFPGSWIGGLFYCDINYKAKAEALRRMGNARISFDKAAVGVCNVNNSIPLLPVKSDDYSKNWTVYEKPKVISFLNKWFRSFKVTKYVPYLYTPNNALLADNFKVANFTMSAETGVSWQKPFREQLLDVVFRNKALNEPINQWFSDIDVEEKYEMSPEETLELAGLTEQTIRKVYDLIGKSNNFVRALIFSEESTMVPKKGNENRFKKLLLKIERHIWKYLPLQDKALMIMASSSSSLSELNRKWKNIKINPEKRKYPMAETKLA